MAVNSIPDIAPACNAVALRAGEESQTILTTYYNDGGLEENIANKETYSLYEYIIGERVWLSSPKASP